MAKAPSAKQLWQFSLALYPKVKHTALQWQDELGANINLLLLLCYLEHRQCSLSPDALVLLANKLHTFSVQYTQPLRAIRRNNHCPLLNPAQQTALKQLLLQTELVLEQLEQQVLVEQCPVPLAAATPMLEQYLAYLAIEPAKQQQQLHNLRQAITQLS